MADLGQKLKKASDNSSLEAEIILAFVLRKDRSWLLAHPEKTITNYELRITNSLVNRRLTGEPLAYILGEHEFYGLPFKVNKNVLIPRPETEEIVELATRNAQRATQKTIIVDVGTGSGTIIISLAKKLKNNNVKYFAIDISSKALAVAKKNAKLNNIKILKQVQDDGSKVQDDSSIKGITFLQGNLLQPLFTKTWKSNAHKHLSQPASWDPELEIGNWKLEILANLPYLKNKLPGLSKQQKINLSFEPRLALVAGADGLKYYKQLAKQIIKLKKTYPQLDIELITEIEPDQVIPMKKLFTSAKKISVKKDFRKLDRFMIFKF